MQETKQGEYAFENSDELVAAGDISVHCHRVVVRVIRLQTVLTSQVESEGMCEATR